MTKQDIELNELNSTVKCKLAPSSIHGIGVFALRDIAEGEKCYCIPSMSPKWYSVPFGSMRKLFPGIGELILERWPAIVNGSHFMSPNDMGWLITFMNHADNPNYDVDTDSAINDISKGTELTEDYRRMTNYEKVYPWL